MVKRLYLDGCSLTYGQGLPRNDSLGSLFKTPGEYDVLDKSRPGKSNIAIAVDTYQNYKNFDTFVLGFSYADRFGIQYQDQNLDFFPGFHGQGLNLNNDSLDVAHVQMYKYFYSVYGPPYSDNLSDMLIDTLVNFLISKNKKVAGFSWQHRNVQCQLAYPYIAPAQRLDDGHLSKDGTVTLFNLLQNILDE
jgi:hypothetical protein